MSLSSTEPICAGDVWQFFHTHDTDKETNRWCVVVIGDVDGYVRVVYGGSTKPPEQVRYVVVEDPQDIKTMGLKNKTYFRISNVLDVKVSAFRRKMGRCPWDIFVAIETIEYDLVRRYKKNVPKQD
jgi:hypothetical protein